ncbi:MAG: rhomboid family intramembrane serine protease [Marinilabiliales bacterium]
MTYIIIVITSIVSVIAFANRTFFNSLLFNPYQIIHRNEYHRIISHAFLHADYLHLIINMIVLYSFGTAVEGAFDYYFGLKKNIYFLLLYFGGIVFSSLFSLVKNRNVFEYNAVGASGAVSAVVFTAIFLSPLSEIRLYFAVPIPGIVFGVLYLAYSFYMSRRKNDFIAHDAHFWGAVFGLIFPVILEPKLFNIFIYQIFG